MVARVQKRANLEATPLISFSELRLRRNDMESTLVVFLASFPRSPVLIPVDEDSPAAGVAESLEPLCLILLVMEHFVEGG